MKLLKLAGIVALVLGIGVGAQSCKSAKGVALGDLGGAWNLKTLNGEEASTSFENKVPSLKIDVASSSLSGYGGCNTYRGGFKLEKGVFSAPNLATTMMMCMHQNKESEYLKIFSAPSKLSISEVGTLVFTQGESDVLVFERSFDIDPADLAGTWTLDKIGDNAVAGLFNNERLPTIEFQNDRLGGNGGCNRYNGQYKLEGNVIKVGPLMSTRMACDFLDGEGKLLKALEGEAKLVMDGNALNFVKDGATVLSFKK